MQVLCGYIDLNTYICGSTRIYAIIVATLHTQAQYINPIRCIKPQKKKKNPHRVDKELFNQDQDQLYTASRDSSNVQHLT